ncbi:hypothetical protein [Austwickia chelonae]|uniref:hypothetical protein n=1 Tax=Austwickia chelonae TaxID=100225 RepID=UPI000E275ABE|nr:hypothetical protein [Austwickia chelonae]
MTHREDRLCAGPVAAFGFWVMLIWWSVLFQPVPAAVHHSHSFLMLSAVVLSLAFVLALAGGLLRSSEICLRCARRGTYLCIGAAGALLAVRLHLLAFAHASGISILLLLGCLIILAFYILFPTWLVRHFIAAPGEGAF